jgi:hypothetical protein
MPNSAIRLTGPLYGGLSLTSRLADVKKRQTTT